MVEGEMLIRNVDIPEPLIEAHREGKLVIFVGAGASIGPDSNLPDFRTLARDVASDAEVEFDEKELSRPDLLLGRLADRDVDVHLQIAERIGDPSSLPNSTHEAIVAVARSGVEVRIVTTNYDLHLSAAIQSVSDSHQEYVGPALPMGDDFTGLVYLHGNLLQDPRHLVVTDRDFGRAYLRDAWAARFLERMFATYTVLFIGYSHSDIVMKYLGRSLGRESRRYAFAKEPAQAPDSTNWRQFWRQLGIYPIGYELVGESHEELVHAIKGWAKDASMGMLEHQQRIARLVSAAPSRIPDEDDYLQRMVADPETVGLFTASARGQEWLDWAGQQPHFKRMFEPTAEENRCTLTLANWFAEHFVGNEELSSAALEVVRVNGGELGPQLWVAVGSHIHRMARPRPNWVSPWLLLLVQSPQQVDNELLEYALDASQWPDHRQVALLLFEHLTEPRAKLQSRYGSDVIPRFDVVLRGDVYGLAEAWRNLFQPNLEDAAPELLAIADENLRSGHRIGETAGSNRWGWDPLSDRRMTIRSEPQNAIPTAVDVLIDAARDSLETELNANNSTGPSYIAIWAASNVPILQRLAIHGWAIRSDVDDTAKISWLRESGWLQKYQLRPEVFHLIEMALPNAARDVADALVADITADAETATDEDLSGYAKFNILAWIAEKAPDLMSAEEALGRLREEHPEFETRSRPDLSFSTEFRVVPPNPPMTVVELHESIATNAEEAILDLQEYRTAERSSTGPTWEDAERVLIETVRNHPLDGLAALDVDADDDGVVLRAVVRGWEAADVDEDTANRILARLAQTNVQGAVSEISRLLADGGRGEGSSTAWYRSPAAQEVATVVWDNLGSETPESIDGSWLFRAINRPAGQLTQFWIAVIEGEWQDTRESWTGLAHDNKASLEKLLSSRDDRSINAEIILSSQVYFFYKADREWCEETILPLLSWEDPVRALRTWDGFLAWGRWDDGLLAAGLDEHYMGAIERIESFSEESRQRLLQHLAGVAVYSETDPLPWIKTFTAKVDTHFRKEWMNQVAWTLADLPSEAVEHRWQRWMRQYWTDRIASIPLVLTTEEASAMASWVVHLTDSIEEGVDLAVASPASLDGNRTFLRSLKDAQLDQYPAQFARLLGHLLEDVGEPFWGCLELKRIVLRTSAQASTDDLTSIVNAALRLGCTGAADWLPGAEIG